jgi:hypothetical protein
MSDEHIIELIKEELKIYRGFKPCKRDLVIGVQLLDNTVNVHDLSRIIEEGNYCEPEARRTEPITCKEDIKIDNFYLNTVMGRTCRVHTIKENEISYTYFDFGIDIRSTTVENFIKYFVLLPDQINYE